MASVGRKAAQERGARINATAERFWHESDAMHALLVKRAELLMGCRSPEDEELRALADVIEAYGAKRWPQGKEEKPTKPRQYTTRERVIDDLKTMFWRWRKPLPKE